MSASSRSRRQVAGLETSDRLLVFAASQALGTSTQSTHEIDLAFDTDGDGDPNFITFAADTGLVTAGDSDGTVTAFTVDVKTGDLVDAWSAPAPANGSTVEMPVAASSLGLKSGAGKISVSAAGFSTVSAAAGDPATGSATFDAYSPALSQGNLVTVKPGRSSTMIPVTVASSALVGQSHPGRLVVSTDDRAGFAENDRVSCSCHPHRPRSSPARRAERDAAPSSTTLGSARRPAASEAGVIAGA